MARLRVLPIHCSRPGDPTHYLVLDGVNPDISPERAQRTLSALRDQAETPVLMFTDVVELPDVEPKDGDTQSIEVTIEPIIPDSLTRDLAVRLPLTR